jgi:hypothetical protein
MQHGARGAIELCQSAMPAVIRRRKPTVVLDLIRAFDKRSRYRLAGYSLASDVKDASQTMY